MPNIGTCRLCLRRRELVKSHVISELFYRPLYDETGRALAFERHESACGDENWTLSKLQQGLKEHLLCEECDNGHLNRYFEQPSARTWRVLIGEESASAPLEVGLVPGGGLRLRGFDYGTFKLLLLSLLWRCSESSLKAFEQVQLGARHAERIRRMLLDRTAGGPEKYPCIVFLIPDSPRLMAFPVAGRLIGEMGGHRYYHFYLIRCSLMIVVSSHFRGRDLHFEGHDLFDSFAIQPPGELVAPFQRKEDVREPGIIRHAQTTIPQEILARYGLTKSG